MADWDEITKAYREKVREYYGGHIVFVDPKQFNGDPDDDWKTFVKMFKEQFPDDAVLDMDVFQISASVFSDEELIKMIIDFSRHSGPAAMPLDDSVCVVIEPDERFATKEGAVSFRSHIPEDELLPLPQKTVDYIKYIAAHEGPHCWDILPPMEEKTLPLHLKDETVSDFVADMDARGDGQAQVADIFRHSSAMREDFSAWRTRKLSADAHATHIALNDLYEGEGIDYQSVADFLKNYPERVLGRVAETISLAGPDEAAELYKDNPKLFVDVLDGMVAQGTFDDDRRLKLAVKDLVEAEHALHDFDKVSDKRREAAEAKSADPQVPAAPSAALPPKL